MSVRATLTVDINVCVREKEREGGYLDRGRIKWGENSKNISKCENWLRKRE